MVGVLLPRHFVAFTQFFWLTAPVGPKRLTAHPKLLGTRV
jgi:hypothetical protein